MAKQSFAGAFNGLFSEVRVQLAPLPELEAFYVPPTPSRWSILEPRASRARGWQRPECGQEGGLFFQALGLFYGKAARGILQQKLAMLWSAGWVPHPPGSEKGGFEGCILEADAALNQYTTQPSSQKAY